MRGLISLLATLFLAAPAAQATVIIDSFDQVVPFLTTGVNVDAGGYLTSRRASVIGGSIAGGLDVIEGLTVIDLFGGVAAEVQWPDFGGTPDFDLTQAGANDRFELDIGAIAGTWQATIAVDDGTTTFAVPIVGVTTAGTLSFLFSDFTGVDFTTVDSVRLLFTNLAGPLDVVNALELRATPVPEPGAAGLFGFGLLGLAFLGSPAVTRRIF